MKGKNILWGFALLVVAIVCCWAFSSCGDDKDEVPQNPMMGAWVFVKDEAVAQQLEQKIVTELSENDMLTQETIYALTKIKKIVATSEFLVQFDIDGTVRLYAYHNGIGPFVSGTWQMTEQALLLQVADLTLAVINIQLDGNTMHCKIDELPLTFKKYTK